MRNIFHNRNSTKVNFNKRQSRNALKENSSDQNIFQKTQFYQSQFQQKAMPENSKKKIHIRNGCFTKSISNTEQPIPETTQPSLTKSSTTKRQTDFKFKRVYKKTEFQPLQKWQTKKLSTKSNNNTTAEQQRSMQHYNDMPNA